jgi:hypothetical protein
LGLLDPLRALLADAGAAASRFDKHFVKPE